MFDDLEFKMYKTCKSDVPSLNPLRSCAGNSGSGFAERKLLHCMGRDPLKLFCIADLKFVGARDFYL